MPLKILRADITTLKVDAIVNAANNSLLGGGGVDGAIHRAAGPDLLKECRTLNGCETGDAKATKGYRLPAKYVIHTVGPIWRGGTHGERELLISCYRRSLQIAAELGCETVAFPLISAGVYGYPVDQAITVAEETIREFLDDDGHDGMTVTITVFGHRASYIAGQRFRDLKALIDDAYTDAVEESESCRGNPRRLEQERMQLRGRNADGICRRRPEPCAPCGNAIDDLRDRLNTIDEGFVGMLLRKIDERGMKDSECYRRANIDRRLFNKIKNNKDYKPGKPTVIAFAIALELSPREADELLMKAGFALSDSTRFDVIVKYYIDHRIYDILEINNALFEFDQPLLGA